MYRIISLVRENYFDLVKILTTEMKGEMSFTCEYKMDHLAYLTFAKFNFSINIKVA